MPGISKTVVSLQPGKMEEVTKFLDAQSGLVTELPKTVPNQMNALGCYSHYF